MKSAIHSRNRNSKIHRNELSNSSLFKTIKFFQRGARERDLDKATIYHVHGWPLAS